MAKSYYLPHSDQDRVVWLNNFANKFGAAAAGLGLSADVTSVNNDAAMFAYIVNRAELFTSYKEQLINFKKLLRGGPLGTSAMAVQAIPTIAAPPTAVAAGIFLRIAQLVQRIKNSATYTEAMGKDLSIIGAEIASFDEDVMKPALKLVIKGGRAVEIQWTKGKADALYIEADKGSGWQFMAVDTIPHYTDTTPITGPATWKYRAMYLVNDERVGNWSDIMSITVG
jgi:hypothetical protein